MPNLIDVEYSGLRKIISGGQDGVDLGALRAAKAFGLPTGGVAPAGYRTAHGLDPSLKRYGLTEHRSRDYPPRTFQNVYDSDGTLIIASIVTSAGTQLTAKYARDLKKPYRVVVLPKESYRGEWPEDRSITVAVAASWIVENRISILNVAGNHKSPNYHEWETMELVRLILIQLQADGRLTVT